MNENNLDELFENIKKDKSLLSNIDIDELLSTIDKDNNDLEDKTLNDIIDTNIQVLNTLELTNDDITNYCNKLAGYKYIDHLNQLHKGKYIRWINKSNKLTNGAIFLELSFLDNGTNLICKNVHHRYLQLKFDDVIIFQKLSTQEQLILMAYEYATK